MTGRAAALLDSLSATRLAVAGIPIVLLLMALTAIGAGGQTVLWENAHWTVADALAFGIAVLGARAAKGLERRVRGLLALGLGSYFLAQLLWDLQVALGINAFPAPSDLFYVLLGVPVLVAFVVAVRGQVEKSDEAAYYLDVAIALVVVAVLLESTFGEQAVTAGTVAGLTVLAYPFSYFVAASAGILSALTTRSASVRGTYLVVAGLVLLAVTSLAWASASLTAFPPPGSLVNYGFSVGVIVVALGSAAWRSRRSQDESYDGLARVLLGAFPFAATLVIAINDHGLEHLDAGLIAVISVVLLVLLRTTLILREHNRTLAGQQATRRQLVQAIDAQRAAEGVYRSEVELFERLTERLAYAADELAMSDAAEAVLRRLVPTPAGDIMLMSASRDRLVVAQSWGDAPGARQRGAEVEGPLSCLGIKRGSTYELTDASDELLTHCPIHPASRGTVLCVPMLAVGEAVGVIHLERYEPGAFEASERGLATRVAEQAALALSNTRLVRAMESLAMSDQLTGLRNARFFDPYLDRELAAADRDKTPLGLLMADLDHFKQFNDTYGHAAGDEALRAFARAALGALRKSDTIARYGGEEFVLLVRQADLAAAAVAAEKVRAAVESTDVTIGPGRWARITVSLGVASTSVHPADRLSLLRYADQALYRAKQRGRNRVEVADRPDPDEDPDTPPADTGGGSEGAAR